MKMVASGEYGGSVLLGGIVGTGITTTLGAWAGHLITGAKCNREYRWTPGQWR